MRAAALSAAALALAATAPATNAARLAAKTVADTLAAAPKVSVQWYTEALCTSRAARPAHPPHTTERETHQGVPTAGHAAQRRAARRATSAAVALLGGRLGCATARRAGAPAHVWAPGDARRGQHALGSIRPRAHKGLRWTRPPLASGHLGSASVGLFEPVDEYFGDSEKFVRHCFAVARANAPACIFIDEVDASGTRLLVLPRR